MNQILRAVGRLLLFVTPVVITIAQGPHFAYVVNEASNTVSVYSIDPNTGALTQVSVASTGSSPGSIAIDPTGRFGYVSNGISNDISAYNIDPNAGALNPMPGSPFAVPGGSELASIAIHPSGALAFVSTDEIITSHIFVLAVNTATGALSPLGSPVAAESTSSPLTIDPTGRFLYMTSGRTKILAFSINVAAGALVPIPGSPFGGGLNGGNIAIDPTGRFLYFLNDLLNTVSAFTIDTTTGALSPITDSPFATGGVRGIGATVDPTGRFFYSGNRDSNNVSAFTINPSTGALTPIPGSPFAADSGPFFIAVNPSGQFAYAMNIFSNDVSAYNITPTTGTLTQISNSPFPAGAEPVWMAFSQDYNAQIQQPINADGSSVFNAKRGVVPVKFTLTLHGVSTCALPPATIALTRTAGTAPGMIDESVFLLASDTGSNFRVDSCQYVYNLDTRWLGPGTYLIQINTAGVTVGTATFGMR